MRKSICCDVTLEVRMMHSVTILSEAEVERVVQADSFQSGGLYVTTVPGDNLQIASRRACCRIDSRAGGPLESGRPRPGSD
jgi:hypothetical protein